MEKRPEVASLLYSGPTRTMAVGFARGHGSVVPRALPSVEANQTPSAGIY